MATKNDTKIKPVLPGTPEMETLIAAGYNMSLEEAKEIIKTRKESPALVSYDDYKKATAFLAAYSAKATVVHPKENRGDGKE